MALIKKHTKEEGGTVDYWKVISVSSVNMAKKVAVIKIAGFKNKKARDKDLPSEVEHEFAIMNRSYIEQETRPATDEERDKMLGAEAVKGLTPEELALVKLDVVLSEKEVIVNDFDNFIAKYTEGKWEEGAYEYLKSGAPNTHEFFNGSKDD